MTPPREGGSDCGDEAFAFTYPRDEGDQPTMKIVEAVAEVKGTSTTDLTPIAESLDPDALNALMNSFGRSENRQSGEVSFEYEGCLVMVEPGRIEIRIR